MTIGCGAPLCVIATYRLAQTKISQDKQDNHDEADNIYELVHCIPELFNDQLKATDIRKDNAL
ncbi:MAG TPA: hypothetical protein DHW36_15740 [Thalassospira sp.]|nr:hypothetical protein [Thalassospira sp.]